MLAEPERDALRLLRAARSGLKKAEREMQKVERRWEKTRKTYHKTGLWDVRSKVNRVQERGSGCFMRTRS